MFDIGSGVSALLGAAVGGVATYAGTWQNLKFQARQAKHARTNSLLDKRHDTHQQMIISLYRFVERSRALEERLTAKLPTDDAVVKYLEAWEEVNVGRGAALLAGPRAVGTALLDMMGSAAEYSNLLDNWRSGKGKSREFGDIRGQFESKRVTYIETARVHLSLD